MMCFCEFVAIVGLVWLLTADYESVVSQSYKGGSQKPFLRNPSVNIKHRFKIPM